MRPLPIEPLSRMPCFVLGLSIIRRSPVPVIDARRLLNGGDAPGRTIRHDVELTPRAFARSNIVDQLVVVTDGEAALNYLFAIGPHADRDPYALCRRRSCSTSTCRR
jgi:chemotaxis signal transduction protein